MKAEDIIANKIKILREKKNLTQSAFGARIHIHPQMISKWERGSGKPSCKSLEKIEEAFPGWLALPLQSSPPDRKNVQEEDPMLRDLLTRAEKILRAGGTKRIMLATLIDGLYEEEKTESKLGENSRPQSAGHGRGT